MSKFNHLKNSIHVHSPPTGGVEKYVLRVGIQNSSEDGDDGDQYVLSGFPLLQRLPDED